MSEKQAIVNEALKPPGYLGTIVEASGSHEWEKAEHGITWISGTFILLNTALGVSLLNAPDLYDRLGGITSSILIQIVIITVTITTMYVMCACADLDDVDTYDEVIDYMCGRIVQKLSALSIMFTCFGICVTFLVIIGDLSDRTFATFHGPDFCNHWYFSREFIIVLATCFFIWPSACAKHLPNVLFANFIGASAVFYMVFVGVYVYFRSDVEQVHIKLLPDDAKGVIAALPIAGFAYQTHVNLIPIYGSFRDRSLKNISKSICLAMIIMFISYTIMGIFGYATFGGKVMSNVMKQYDPSDPLVFLGIIAFIIKMITTYPQMMFCGRQSYYSFIGSDPDEQGTIKHFASNGIINVLILYLALVTPSISQSIKYLGSISACSAFIFPGICMTYLANSSSATVLWSRLSCIFMFVYGILITLFGIVMFALIILNASNDVKSETLEKLCL